MFFKGIECLDEHERWIDVPGCSRYFVSDLGRVISARTGTAKLLDPGKQKGYPILRMIGDDRKTVAMFVHRAVMLAFVGPCPDGMQVCHYNGKRHDNRLVNLRYDTPENNKRDDVRHGAGGRKLSPLQAGEALAMMNEGVFIEQIASKFGVDARTIERLHADQCRKFFATGKAAHPSWAK
jgi:hypothetical protein